MRKIINTFNGDILVEAIKQPNECDKIIFDNIDIDNYNFDIYFDITESYISYLEKNAIYNDILYYDGAVISHTVSDIFTYISENKLKDFIIENKINCLTVTAFIDSLGGYFLELPLNVFKKYFEGDEFLVTKPLNDFYLDDTLLSTTMFELDGRYIFLNDKYPFDKLSGCYKKIKTLK